ncbi:MAG: hypothetical protein GWP69_02970 [Gammaproteobacteria bacterium]|nr:hypothetical protein [Gammaproteobacteria bacterium]
MPMRRVFLVFMVLAGWAASSQAADLVVIASSDPSIKVGVVIDGVRPMRVAAGASVVMISSAGKTIKLSGPYSGAPDTSASSSDRQLVDSLSRLITEEAKSPTTLAVFRGGLKPLPTGRPDIWGIDIAREGNYCLRPDRPAMLWWAAARSGAVVGFASTGDNARSARIKWPRGKRYVAWPKELTLSDGGTYVARFWSEDNGEQLHTVLMPNLATDAHRAAWMAEHECTRQALRVLAAIGKEEL